MSPADDAALTECPSCHREVPAANFCGLCGAALAAPAGSGRRLLRIRTFGACPSESVLRPSLASSLFPHLPQRSRLPFRIGLAAMVAGLALCAALRIPSVMVGVGALGLPLLFVLYLRASGVSRDLPRAAMPVAVVLGLILGAGWAWFAGAAANPGFGVAMNLAGAGHDPLRGNILATTAGAVLMMVPAVVVRFTMPRTRESLDGFVIGTLGALAFSAAATLTRLAPQLQATVVALSRPRSSLAVEAVVCGVVVPLTAAVAGGVVGLALWFVARGDQPLGSRLTLWLLGAAVLAMYAAVGVVNAMGLPNLIMVSLHLLLVIVGVLVLRMAVQFALLHEVPDPVSLEPLLCEHCEHVVPDAAFCPACGAATRASSQESRRFRRNFRPVPITVGGGS